MADSTSRLAVDRIQTGVRMERRMVKVLKALAEYESLSFGELLEDIVLHVFEGKTPFSEATLAKIAALKSVYELGPLPGCTESTGTTGKL